ncbi:dipeptidase [candidate division KSB1 bacterium]|nr:dipeptidase [candidate division KSB1 bacterium]
MKDAIFFLFVIALFAISNPIIAMETDANDEQVKHALDLHHRIFTIDTHTDTPLRMDQSGWDIGVANSGGNNRSNQVDLPRMRAGGMDAIFFAAFVAQRDRTPENYQYAQKRADELIGYVKAMCQQYPDKIALAMSPDDGYTNTHKGLLSAYLGVENGFAIGTDIANIQRYYDMGVRYITLCHTKNNDICDSSNDTAEHNGLGDFGVSVVQEMNRLGMIIDVSHISDASFFDVLDLSKAPVMASHSCCRAVCNNPRNLSDDMLRAFAKKNGVIQMCVFTEYVKLPEPNPERDRAMDELEKKYGSWDNVNDPQIREQYQQAWHDVNIKYPRKKATMADFVDHIDHVKNLIGVDYVGIGTDFDGGGGLNGCDNVAEMPNITIELVKRGYSDEEIEKIWGGNFMRVFRDVVAAAQ